MTSEATPCLLVDRVGLVFVDGNILGKHTPDAATPARPTTPHHPACILEARESWGTKNGSRGGTECCCREPLSTGLTGTVCERWGVFLSTLLQYYFNVNHYRHLQQLAARSAPPGVVANAPARYCGGRSSWSSLPSMADSLLKVGLTQASRALCRRMMVTSVDPRIVNQSPAKENLIVTLLCCVLSNEGRTAQSNQRSCSCFGQSKTCFYPSPRLRNRSRSRRASP